MNCDTCSFFENDLCNRDGVPQAPFADRTCGFFAYRHCEGFLPEVDNPYPLCCRENCGIYTSCCQSAGKEIDYGEV